MFNATTSALRQSRRNEDHEAGEHYAKRAFEEQAPDGKRDVRGLVELVANLNIVRQYGLETWQVGFDGLDNRERRGVCSFGYRDVDGAVSIYQRVTSLDVGAVFNRSDVAYEDCSRSLRADRNVVELLEIRNDRIDRHH